jgi:arsenite methyltransferase
MQTYLDNEFDLNDPSFVSVIDELPLWSAPFGLKLLDTVTLKPHIRALDLGCGTGFPLIELAQRLGSSCQIYGLDPWERAVERVRLKISTLDIRNVVVLQAAGEEMPFQDKIFDLIVSNNGINNVEDPEKVLRECFRTARPGAQMVMTVNLPETMHEFYDVYESVLKELCTASEVEGMRTHIYSKRKPLQDTEEMIRKAGFNSVKANEDAFSWRFVDGTTMLKHAVIRFAFMDPWKSIVAAHDVERIFKVLEDTLNLISEEKGELRLTIPFACIDCEKK